MFAKLRMHSASDYSTLSHIDEVLPLSDKQMHCLNELGWTLAQNDVSGQIGVGLLHRHFEVEDSELMVENADIVAGETWTTPVPKQSQDAHSALPTFVAFDCLGEAVGMEYTLDISEREACLRAIQSSKILDAVKSVLREFSCEKTFGLISLQAEYDLGDGEVFLESCDPTQRLLWSRRTSFIGSPSSAIQTRWRWSWESGQSECQSKCRRVPLLHCVGTCLPLGGHQSTHLKTHITKHIGTNDPRL